MSADGARELEWTSQFTVAPVSANLSLTGDKITLPPKALEELLAAAPSVTNEPIASRDRNSNFDPFNPYSFAAERYARSQFQTTSQQLPHPLTFRLVNPSTGVVVYAGIREFSGDDIGLSSYLRSALGLGSGEVHLENSREQQDVGQEREVQQKITVHAKQLPKGEFVKLRPLEAGYDPEDWKALLEEHLRKNYTTLTKGEMLHVPSGRRDVKEFRFLIDEFKPEGEAICVVDTDLEVDIEALNEEQARETLRIIAGKRNIAASTEGSSSKGGTLDLFKEQKGQVLPGEYVDYILPSWVRDQDLEITVEQPQGNNSEMLLFVSPFSNLQRSKPREEEFVFSDLFTSRPTKRIRLSPRNVEMEGAESLQVAVFAPPAQGENSKPRAFTLRARSISTAPVEEHKGDLSGSTKPDEVQCSNCKQWVLKQSLVLHENFCLRNNVVCDRGCGRVYQKKSPAWKDHWHCEHDDVWGDTEAGHQLHDHYFHQQWSCPNCTFTAPTLPLLAQHRTSTCPGKLILCQFCHLVVPQEGEPDGSPNAEALLSGLTPHELADGARTEACHICQRYVRLRDMATHLRNHDHDRLNRAKPRMCRNQHCSRTLDGTGKNGDVRAGLRMGQGAGNEIGLCSICFGPLYVQLHDPEGKALKRRVERRYLTQLITGCNKAWCQNNMCKTGRRNLGEEGTISTKDALPLIKPLLDGLQDGSDPMHFCVDESSQRRRGLAEMMAAEAAVPGSKSYSLPWCIAALEAEEGKLEKAREWLNNYAPSTAEELQTSE